MGRSTASEIRAIAGIPVRSPTSISHAASCGGSNDPFGSVIVTVEPTQSSRTAHSVTRPTSCSTTSSSSVPAAYERTV